MTTAKIEYLCNSKTCPMHVEGEMSEELQSGDWHKISTLVEEELAVKKMRADRLRKGTSGRGVEALSREVARLERMLKIVTGINEQHAVAEKMRRRKGLIESTKNTMKTLLYADDGCVFCGEAWGGGHLAGGECNAILKAIDASSDKE